MCSICEVRSALEKKFTSDLGDNIWIDIIHWTWNVTSVPGGEGANGNAHVIACVIIYLHWCSLKLLAYCFSLDCCSVSNWQTVTWNCSWGMFKFGFSANVQMDSWFTVAFERVSNIKAELAENVWLRVCLDDRLRLSFRQFSRIYAGFNWTTIKYLIFFWIDNSWNVKSHST